MPYAKVNEIRYIPVDDPEKAEWGDYNHLTQRWEGLTKSTAKQWAMEMRNNEKFRDGIINPTHKIVFVNYEVFRNFVKWKQENRFRRNKK